MSRPPHSFFILVPMHWQTIVEPMRAIAELGVPVVEAPADSLSEGAVGVRLVSDPGGFGHFGSQPGRISDGDVHASATATSALLIEVEGSLDQRRVVCADLCERIIDEDGPEPPGDRAERNRTANLNQNPFDLTWDLSANVPSVDGAFLNNVLRAYTNALFDQDWTDAKNQVGDSVCEADLARTHAQRKADALVQIFADAAANTNGMAPVGFTHNIVMSASVFEEMARRFAGARPRQFDPDDYRCETIDGDPLDPTEAFANSVLNKIRRVVVDAKGVVVDMGTARLFTGLARDAVRITGRECFWPGCWMPATQCETDHLHDHAKGGRTNPGNGAPGCGRHNRWREVRLASLRLCEPNHQRSRHASCNRVHRDDQGRIRTYRPDETEIK